MSFRDKIAESSNLFSKTNRNDRYRQISKQEQLIEEKKRQIQEKLELQKKQEAEAALKKVNPKIQKIEKKPLVFSNDGSFLDQFKKIAATSGSQKRPIIIERSEENKNSTSDDTEDKTKKNDDNEEPKQEARSASGTVPGPPSVVSAPTNVAVQPTSVPPPPLPQQNPFGYPTHFQPPHPFSHLPFGLPPPPPPPPPTSASNGSPSPYPPLNIGGNGQNLPMGVPPPPMPPCFPSFQMPPHQQHGPHNMMPQNGPPPLPMIPPPPMSQAGPPPMIPQSWPPMGPPMSQPGPMMPPMSSSGPMMPPMINSGPQMSSSGGPMMPPMMNSGPQMPSSGPIMPPMTNSDPNMSSSVPTMSQAGPMMLQGTPIASNSVPPQSFRMPLPQSSNQISVPPENVHQESVSSEGCPPPPPRRSSDGREDQRGSSYSEEKTTPALHTSSGGSERYSPIDQSPERPPSNMASSWYPRRECDNSQSDHQRSQIPPLMGVDTGKLRTEFKQEYDPEDQDYDKPDSRNSWKQQQQEFPETSVKQEFNKTQFKQEFDNSVKQEFSHQSFKQEFVSHQDIKTEPRPSKNERKRKSRWSDDKEVLPQPAVAAVPQVTTIPAVSTFPVVSSVPKINVPGMSGHLLTKVTRSDPGLVRYAKTAYGSTHLTEEDWKKAEENYKVHLLYQDMMAKRAEVEKLRQKGKHKFEYDSDEEVDEKGTWEHKLRETEMKATQDWASSLTEMAKGKHHIGDFLPPDELKKFMAKYEAVKGGGGEPDLSDYKEYKLTEENKGFQMLQKLGWSEGQGLGSGGAGRLDPINKGQSRDFNEGLGHARPDDVSQADDEYDAYRKRMMLAYRFRPNPLNNPRRPYY